VEYKNERRTKLVLSTDVFSALRRQQLFGVVWEE